MSFVPPGSRLANPFINIALTPHLMPDLHVVMQRYAELRAHCTSSGIEPCRFGDNVKVVLLVVNNTQLPHGYYHGNNNQT